jgi:hypothetical protein
MRGGKQRERGMREGGPSILMAAGIFVLVGGYLSLRQADAADLDGRVSRLPRIAAPGPCQMVPQPQTNLAGEVIGFRPSLVCLSRGLYADRRPPPPPPPRPWWWLGW